MFELPDELPMTELPDELWTEILKVGIKNSDLNHQDICHVSMCCKRLRRLADEDCIWSAILGKNAPVGDGSKTGPIHSKRVTKSSLRKRELSFFRLAKRKKGLEKSSERR